MPKIPVYFVPGLAASTRIFEYIQLPESLFNVHYIDWILPEPDDTIASYAERMCAPIPKNVEVVLVGVSFGGIMVQEMASFVKIKKIIIISSVKSNQELPAAMHFAKVTHFYKLLPTSWLGKINYLARYAKGKSIIAKQIKLYNKYLYMKHTQYLDWSIKNIIHWNRTVADSRVIHIHGDSDMVFPIKHIKNCITIHGGTHIMIITKFKWFNEHLPQLILE